MRFVRLPHAIDTTSEEERRVLRERLVKCGDRRLEPEGREKRQLELRDASRTNIVLVSLQQLKALAEIVFVQSGALGSF